MRCAFLSGGHLLPFSNTSFWIHYYSHTRMRLSPLALAALVATTTPASATTSMRGSRQLANFDKIANYQPTHNVWEALNIDRDVYLMQQNLAVGTEAAYERAADVYVKGAYSIPYAELELVDAVLHSTVEQGTIVRGENAAGQIIEGILLEQANQGEGTLKVAYAHANVNAGVCSVGGNPNPIYDGCFANEGEIMIEHHGQGKYVYDPTVANKNERTIARMSTQARNLMMECGTDRNCPYELYKQFVTYYGEFDYANQWIVQAFLKGSTEFSHGNADWTTFDSYEAVQDAITMAAAFMNVAMFAIGELEASIADCQQQDADSASFRWDAAVAYWTGTRDTGAQMGHLMYTLADVRCGSFQTCAPVSDAHPSNEFGYTSRANVDIFDAFVQGKDAILLGNCQAAQEQKERITQLYFIPLIQGLLRYAHMNRDDAVYSEKHHAEGAAYAAAVLPVLHTCNKKDAEIVYQNMKATKADKHPVNFAEVKEALERNYECLQLTCADIGGLWDKDANAYKLGAEPCTGNGGGQSSSSSKYDKTTIEILGITVGGILAALVLVCTISCCCKRRTKQAYSAEETDKLSMAGYNTADDPPPYEARPSPPGARHDVHVPPADLPFPPVIT